MTITNRMVELRDVLVASRKRQEMRRGLVARQQQAQRETIQAVLTWFVAMTLVVVAVALI